jgi:hypothetical protein
LLFNFSLMATFAPADSESNLLECCRRAGKHHCSSMGSMSQASSMQDAVQQSSAPGLRPAAEKCPFPPRGGPSSPYGKTPLLRAARTVIALPLTRPAGPAQAEARYRVSFSRARQKRGPPSPLS